MKDDARVVELERGDGSWENIQEVLRAEFLKLWGVLADKRRRGDRTDQRLRELETRSADAVSGAAFAKHQARVEDIGRALDALGENVHSQHAHALALEERTRALVQTSLGRLQRCVEQQMRAVEAGVSDRLRALEASCDSLLQKVERRLGLVEEELSVFAAAIDRKADGEDVDALKKATDGAIRERCRKAAVDREILALHELVQRQHDALVSRLDGDRAQALADARSESERQEAERVELDARLAQAAAEQRTRLSALEGSLAAQLETRLASVSESLATSTRELQQTAEQTQETRLKQETLELQLLAWKQLVSADWATLQTRAHEGSEAIARLQLDQRSLESASDALAAQLASASAALRGVEQRLLARVQEQSHELRSQLCGEFERAAAEASARASDRKRTRQQLASCADKLGELDQVVKLVGKQLLQNTSQLQSLRAEQHARRHLQLALLTPETLLAADDDDDANDEGANDAPEDAKTAAPTQQEEADEPPPDDAALRELRAQHAALRGAIQDKLRRYRAVLEQPE